ncbi:insulinase family protein [Ruminococcus sp.]|uniref:EF-P 5-aminopentanol modification-associated protein YfmF n=1 Tax=Ruminococcus sp. TaxID=41978 RepID=UPI0025FBAAFD|nr:insulinase family protein [Ruminococcus sp.]MBQ8966318.1 insulinase family protein [Ruminococcus sp.]
MAVNYNRSEIGKGIFLTRICDPKYKSNIVRVRFITPINKDDLGVNALLMSMLITSNSEIPSRSELSKKLIGLYGTSIGAVWGNVSDLQALGITISTIRDRFTIGGEVISEEAVRQLLLCIFSPDLTDGKFKEKYFRLRRQELLDNIAAAVNDKRSYAFMKAREVIYEGEPAAATDLGSAERAEKITQEDLLRQYDFLMKNAVIDITVCGGGEIDSAVAMLTEKFAGMERGDVPEVVYRKFSPVKNEVCRREEPMDIKQSKMFMAYKSDYEDIYVCKVMACLLGGSAFSKLFMNVREKLSVCYYCDSYYQDLKGVMMIESGVDNSNIEKAQKAITAELEAVQNGDFTDTELENTKLYISGNFRSNYDSEWDIAGWYRVQATRGTAYSPEEAGALINAVTREQVIECAKSFKADTVFILKAEEGSADE